MEERVIGFWRYARKSISVAFEDFDIGRDMLLGTLIALGTLALQVWQQLIPNADWQSHKKWWILSLVSPYVVVFGGHAIWKIATSPWRLYQKQQQDVDRANEETANARRDLQVEIARHGGPEVSLVWGYRKYSLSDANRTLFIQNGGDIDAYDVRVGDVGINTQHCGARFDVVPKLTRGTTEELKFELFGDSVPDNHKDELQMVVYASQSGLEKDERGNVVVRFPITVRFKEYGGAMYEANFTFLADDFLAKVNIHLVDRRRIMQQS
jgi:hypothetical protein